MANKHIKCAQCDYSFGRCKLKYKDITQSTHEKGYNEKDR